MRADVYGDVINDEHTYKDIAENLKREQNVIIGWSDEKYTHLDILFSYRAYKQLGNYLQRGLRGNELFVSIIGLGAFGFDINTNQKAPGYIAEKLNLTGHPTVDKIGELINGVINELIGG